MSQQPVFFPLEGGLDLVTPAIALKPGRAVASLNYLPVASGYRRIRGYERFDGRNPPSGATICRLSFFNGNLETAAIFEGSYLFQQPAQVLTAVGYAVAPPVLTGGSYADGTATGYILLVPSAGTFTINRTIKLPENAGVQAGALDMDPDLTGFNKIALLAIGRSYLRGAITMVPGSGPVRGLWFAFGRAYAVRDNEDASAGILYYSELGGPAAKLFRLSIGGQRVTIGGFTVIFSVGQDGWIEAQHEARLDFTNGELEPLEGDTLTQGTTVSAVRRVVVTSGTWGAGTAAGYIHLIDQSGSYGAGVVTIDGIDAFTVSGDSAVAVNPPGGRYGFITQNFYGASNLTRVYGAGGVGMAFEFDGIAVREIPTGMQYDTPTRIAEYKRSLFLAFPGGSVQFSQPGEPTVFNPVVGAGEIATGDEITDFLAMPNALGILGENSVNMLYGNDAADYQMERLNDEAGVLPWTAQRIGNAVYLDNRGLRSLTATQAFGNFNIGTLSQMIEPLLSDYRRDLINPTASLLFRSQGQYWLFFDNGTAVVFLFTKKNPEAMPVNLGYTVTCAASVEDEGVERIFVGSSEGYVYELDRGTSFDGRIIEHYLRLPFNHFGAPQTAKRVHKVSIDMEATGTTTLSVSADLDLGAVVGVPPQTLIVTSGGGAIDDLGSNESYYASQIETVAEAYLGAVGKTVSLKISGSSSTEEPHVLTGVTYHISQRGLRR